MSSKKPDHYQKYLASVHGNWVTPDDVISDIVKEGAGKKLISKKRIIAGEANEVYNITINNNTDVILRIAKSAYPNFLQEKWAIEKVEKLGVPVPKILFIKHFTVDGEEKSACLMVKVDGEPLERGKINFDEFDLAIKRRLINQAGEILSKIHSVETEGFGWIIGEGKPEYKTSSKFIDGLIKKQEQFEKMASEEDLDKYFIRRALEIINGFKGLYSKVKSRLNHGDYSHKHFMVKNNNVVAILDWGGVRSDTPVYDFAWWDYWFGEYIPTKWLKEGYSNKELFSDNFDDLLHMLRLYRGLETLNWYHQEKYKPAVDKAKAKLLKDLKYFK